MLPSKCGHLTVARERKSKQNVILFFKHSHLSYKHKTHKFARVRSLNRNVPTQSQPSLKVQQMPFSLSAFLRQQLLTTQAKFVSSGLFFFCFFQDQLGGAASQVFYFQRAIFSPIIWRPTVNICHSLYVIIGCLWLSEYVGKP